MEEATTGEVGRLTVDFKHTGDHIRLTYSTLLHHNTVLAPPQTPYRSQYIIEKFLGLRRFVDIKS